MMNKPKTLMYNGFEIAFKIDHYCDNSRIALVMFEYTSYGCPYAYGVASINIDDIMFNDNQMYVDENNNPGIAKLLVDNGLATYVGYNGQSGFCTYPLVELNFAELQQYCIVDDVDEDEEAENIDEGPDDADDNIISFDQFLAECNSSYDF